MVDKVAPALQSALGPELDDLGRQTGVIQRQRKFTGSSLIRTIVLTVMRFPNPQTAQFVATAALGHVYVTATAVEKRFDEKLPDFVRASLERAIERSLALSAPPTVLLEKFTAVEVADSTGMMLPDLMADEFPGPGGKSGSGKAMVKIQLGYDLRAGGMTKFDFQSGRETDLNSDDPDAPIVPGSLLIRDLGYFSLKRFARRSKDGAYWISRWQPGTAVFTPDGQRLDLLVFAQQHVGPGPIDMPILLGKDERLPCRLIVLRVPPEMAARRRQKAYERAQKHGHVPSPETLALCDWTIFVTNCPETLLTWKEVVILYRARWQIELVFKLWKSHNQLAAFDATRSAEERMVLFWAKLIAVLIQHWLPFASAGSGLCVSHWKAAAQIREWALSLARVLDDLAALTILLEELIAVIRATAGKKRRKRSPSLFQLLENPELLDWNS